MPSEALRLVSSIKTCHFFTFSGVLLYYGILYIIFILMRLFYVRTHMDLIRLYCE